MCVQSTHVYINAVRRDEILDSLLLARRVVHQLMTCPARQRRKGASFRERLSQAETKKESKAKGLIPWFGRLRFVVLQMGGACHV